MCIRDRPSATPVTDPAAAPEGGRSDETAGVLIINEPEGVNVPWRAIGLVTAAVAAVGFTVAGIRGSRGGGKDPWAR